MYITLGLFFASLVICIGVFFWFQNANYKRIVSQNLNYIEDSALQEANQIEQNLKSAEALVSNAAKQFSTLSTLQNGMDPKELIAAIFDNSLFDRIAYVAPDGQYYSLEETTEVSAQAYFERAMRGVTGRQALSESRVTHEPAIIFYSPVTINGQLSGAMAGFYEQNMLKEMFSNTRLNYNAHTYILDAKGNVIVSSEDDETSTTILEKLNADTFEASENYASIVNFVHDDNAKCFSFSFGGVPNTFVGTIVKFKENDWLLMSVLPSSVTENIVNAANRSGVILETILIFVFVLYIISMLISSQRQEKYLRSAVASATADLNQTLIEERKQQAIIGSLTGIYSYAYYVNLTDGTYMLLKRTDNYSAGLPENGSLASAVEFYEENLIWPSYRDEMHEFLDPETLPERLESSDTLSTEYQRSDSKWCRGTFVIAEQGQNGKVSSAIYAIQIIEGEKQKEQATQSALHDAYEAAQLASRAKTAFLSNMSHDMRTPMNAIIGMTAIAGTHLDDPERVSDCLTKITASSRHLLALINEVLDMSRIESGKVYLTEEDFNLSDLFDNMLALNQSLISAKGHELNVNVHNLTHENVVGDSVRLQQVFTNLLSNAVKYTPDGGNIDIDITERNPGRTDSGWYVVTFQDNGIGMTQDFTKHLFEPFSRADDKRVDKIQGTGLGMSIARNIIRMMDGDILVESEPGKGSKFTVTFSLKLQTDEQDYVQDFTDIPVLVADDDEMSCESACDILDSLGMRSDYVLSGEEAVKKVSERLTDGDEYFAVILDWKMPGIGGLGAAKEIREIVGDSVPIIIISAYDWTEIEQEAKEAGANAFISKPLFKSRVTKLFGELMGQQHPAQEQKTIADVMSRYSFKGKRALLAEDNELNAEIAVEILDMSGLEVETVTNGKETVETFSSSEPGYFDLILMDIQMPIMDGYEASMAIRSLDREDAKTIPIVAMTANAFASDVQKALASGMNGHISKPLDPEHLIKVLANNLKDN